MSRRQLPPLDRKISVLGADFVENDAGEQVQGEWSVRHHAWASYEPVSDVERLRAAAVEQKIEARFTVRWTRALALITGENRLRFEGADWQITGIKEIGRRKRLEISAWKTGQAGN